MIVQMYLDNGWWVIHLIYMSYFEVRNLWWFPAPQKSPPTRVENCGKTELQQSTYFHSWARARGWIGYFHLFRQMIYIAEDFFKITPRKIHQFEPENHRFEKDSIIWSKAHHFQVRFVNLPGVYTCCIFSLPSKEQHQVTRTNAQVKIAE